jgi:glycosyltransferase involved in cell wall biosynthesis
MKRVFLPFDLPVFESLNSNHPLLASLTGESYPGIEFVRASAGGAGSAPSPEVFEQAARFRAQLGAATPGRPGGEEALTDFVLSRDLRSQAWVDSSCDLAFFHTTPVLLNQMPYVIHFEAPTMLFFPAMLHGATAGVRLRQTPIYAYVRAMLESSQCRALFTNLAISADHVQSIFDSEAISRKTRYVAPGAYLTPREVEQAAAGVARRADKQRVDILFTNSWHQAAGNFFLRGGLDLVLAFLAIEQQCPNLHLTLRSVWPPQLATHELARIVQQHARIRLLPDKLTDQQIMDLYLDADIFCLDAAGVHSLSVLRAMYCGAVCIVSDAPGYEEYVEHDQTGIVIEGRRAAVYSPDPETGWLRDDYASMYTVNPPHVERLARALKALYDHPEQRRRIGLSARERALQRNSFEGWKSGFETIVRAALAGGAAPTA